MTGPWKAASRDVSHKIKGFKVIVLTKVREPNGRALHTFVLINGVLDCQYNYYWWMFEHVALAPVFAGVDITENGFCDLWPFLNHAQSISAILCSSYRETILTSVAEIAIIWSSIYFFVGPCLCYEWKYGYIFLSQR